MPLFNENWDSQFNSFCALELFKTLRRSSPFLDSLYIGSISDSNSNFIVSNNWFTDVSIPVPILRNKLESIFEDKINAFTTSFTYT